MHRHLRTGLAVCGLLFAAAGAAQAQYAFDEETIPPRAVAWRLGERGFSGIGRPRFDGRAYVVEAFDPDGIRVRLFVDARNGAILGRRRLEEGPMAIARPAPGYGWTEEDEMPRRPMRQAERLLPPADIPMPESRGVPLRRPAPDAAFARPDGSIGSGGRASADPNPQGVNPDRRGRPETPRRVARVGSPARGSDGKVLDGRQPDGKPFSRPVPDAPRLPPVEAAKPEPKPETPVATADRPDAAPRGVAGTPAAVQPPTEGTVAKAAESKPADIRTSDAKPGDQTWKNPPEPKRNVRVIGGATLVPGTPDKDAPTP